MMAALPIGTGGGGRVIDETRIGGIGAAIVRARDRRLTVLAAEIHERVRSAPRFIRLRDLAGGVMNDQLEKVLVESGEQMLRFFASAHLPPKLQAVSEQFASLAMFVVTHVPQSAERTVALRKLLEGKDAAVRAVL